MNFGWVGIIVVAVAVASFAFMGTSADWVSAIADWAGVIVATFAFYYAKKAFDGQKEALDEQIAQRNDDEEYRRSMEFFNMIQKEGDDINELFEKYLVKDAQERYVYYAGINFIEYIEKYSGFITHGDVKRLFEMYLFNHHINDKMQNVLLASQLAQGHRDQNEVKVEAFNQKYFGWTSIGEKLYQQKTNNKKI